MVADKAKAAKIGLIAVDDDIAFADGAPVAYVGMNAMNIGKQVGTEIARILKEEGWDKDLAKVRIGSIEDQKADTCMRRNQGAREALVAAIPGAEARILSIPYDNTMVNSIDVVSTTLTSNPDAEKWVFFSCNDDGVLGGVRATENAGLAASNVVGFGIDGSRSCEAFASGQPTGFRGTMWLGGGGMEVSGAAYLPREPSDSVRAGIGLVPEDRKQEALLLQQPVRDNISLVVPDKVSRLGFFSRRKERALVDHHVSELRVKTPSIDQAVGKLSGGNQQKVVFARWQARGPKVLILDEPTRGIDVGAKAEIYRLIESLADQGLAILLISSEMPELLGLADRVIVMQDGTVSGELAWQEATEEAVLALAMRPEAELRERKAS